MILQNEFEVVKLFMHKYLEIKIISTVYIYKIERHVAKESTGLSGYMLCIRQLI